MKRITQYGLMALMLTFGASMAQAQFVINPNLSYSSAKTEGAGGTSEGSVFMLDLRAGFVMTNGLFLGGTYAHEGSDTGTNDTTATSIAPTVGFFNQGFVAMLTYHFMATAEMDPTTDLIEGAGPQIDVGYVLPVTGSFHLGPQLRWRQLDFGKMESSGVKVDVDYKRTSIDPMINLWFMF